MKKLYMMCIAVLCNTIFSQMQALAQNCSLLQASFNTYESRCAATGAIKIRASGGSGNYRYKTTGPVNTNFTSSDSITGLSAGTYTVTINDIVTNCTKVVSNIVIPGSYQDPRFNLTKTDVTCDNGNNASITVTSVQFGREPFSYRIIAPSPAGIGTISSSGIFNNLIAGEYSIQMRDSCGGIQTRRITVNNYTWRINAYPFSQTSCREATGYIEVSDSRGNLSTDGGIPGFQYGIVRSAGDTIWSDSPYFSFTMTHSSFQVIAKDSCGTIKTGATAVSMIPSIQGNVLTSQFTCNSFTATVTNLSNFLQPEFCLYNSQGIQLSCNNTGIFLNLSYGSYCISIYDSCTDTTIQKCFTGIAPPLSVGNQIAIRDKTCTDFTASVTQATGLTNPEFCLQDESGNQLSCNNSGIFTNLLYGSYCIITRDNCRDTSITRCITVTRPVPVLQPLIPAYTHCTVFGLVVDADSVFNPLYCLLDSIGSIIVCNNTGIFDSIPYGPYCVTVYDSCYDSTMTACMSIAGPVIQNDLMIRVDEDRCNSFTITASSNQTISSYCLYDSNNQEVSCNSTGIFNDLPAGFYCVRARIACPDSTIENCIRVRGAVPSVGATVSFSQLTCSGFTATIRRIQNLSNPRFCIYDDQDTLLSCNTSGVFRNLPYGAYCIRITTDCYDTTIIRCFSRWPVPLSINVNPKRSCSYGYSNMDIQLSGAVLPVQLYIYNAAGQLFHQSVMTRNNTVIDSLPETSGTERYMLIVADQCGNRDTSFSNATASFLRHSAVVIPKCPSGTWASGSGNIKTTTSTNMGRITARIIKKNNVNYSAPLVPDHTSGGTSTFNDLGPGTYIIRYFEDDCNKYLYDTVSIMPYQYPNLNRSTAYQCDINGFSVSAIASNGVAPFMYEIIGSVPSSPSIMSAPQSGSIFNINTGTSYSLIRLRAIDACGNATLGDASILPLSNLNMEVSNNCFMYPTTLSVDSIFNAQYAWYRKDSLSSADSTFLDSTTSIYIPMLSALDTGIYICHVVINEGCIKRTYQFNLNGLCHVVLSSSMPVLKGHIQQNKNVLNWLCSEPSSYIIERKTDDHPFLEIGQVNVTQTGIQYFTDASPGLGFNQYRLKSPVRNGSKLYSNILSLKNTSGDNRLTIFPNPATDLARIMMNVPDHGQIIISLCNAQQQVLSRKKITLDGQKSFDLYRPAGLQAGVYFLEIIHLQTSARYHGHVIFK